MNKLTIIGNVTRDPELRSINGVNGPTNVADFTVAVNSRRSRNNQQEDAQFFRVSVFGARANVIQQYLHKGNKIYVIGELSARTYTAQDGTTRVSLEVRADDFEFLTSRAESEAMAAGAPASAPQAPAVQNNGFTDVGTPDDLPF